LTTIATQRGADGWTLFSQYSHPRPTMAPNLQLRSRAPGAGPRGDCIFCSRPCDADGPVVQVWYGTNLRGNACGACLAGNPAEASRQLRSRVAQARAIAGRSQADDPTGRWDPLRGQLGRYAEELEELATVVAGLTEWPKVTSSG
jgi:hypothetical protein